MYELMDRNKERILRSYHSLQKFNFLFYIGKFLVPQSKGRILGYKGIGDIPPNILNSGQEGSAC
jgi:hypothetical protein